MNIFSFKRKETPAPKGTVDYSRREFDTHREFYGNMRPTVEAMTMPSVDQLNQHVRHARIGKISLKSKEPICS